MVGLEGHRLAVYRQVEMVVVMVVRKLDVVVDRLEPGVLVVGMMAWMTLLVVLVEGMLEPVVLVVGTMAWQESPVVQVDHKLVAEMLVDHKLVSGVMVVGKLVSETLVVGKLVSVVEELAVCKLVSGVLLGASKLVVEVMVVGMMAWQVVGMMELLVVDRKFEVLVLVVDNLV